MLRSIRRGVFETNSSSTHSISICRWSPSKESDIPHDTEIEVDGSISSQTEIKDELGKLNYIIAMLSSIAESRDDEYIGSDNRDENFKKLIESNHFTWLKEIVKEKCNTTIIYQSDSNYFPYFETTYDEHYSIETILDCDVDNEESFKERISEIIFDENIVIEDKDNEY